VALPELVVELVVVVELAAVELAVELAVVELVVVDELVELVIDPVVEPCVVDPLGPLLAADAVGGAPPVPPLLEDVASPVAAVEAPAESPDVSSTHAAGEAAIAPAIASAATSPRPLCLQAANGPAPGGLMIHEFARRGEAPSTSVRRRARRPFAPQYGSSVTQYARGPDA
jgi:hypothetical protein